MPTRPKTTAHTLADDFNSPSRGISHDDSLNWAFAVPPSRTRTDTWRILRRRAPRFTTSEDGSLTRSYRLQDRNFERCRYASGPVPIRPRFAPGRRVRAATRFVMGC